MSKSINKGYTTTGDVSGKTLPIAGYVYPDTFRVKSENPAEAVLVNLTSPIDRQERLRIGYKEISDVYQGTSINPAYYAASKQGIQFLVQANDVWSVTDSEDASYRVDLPISVHMIVKVPACETISQADILEAIGRATGCLFDAGTADTWRVTELTKGVLVPKGL